MSEKKYRISSSMAFNLGSMITHVEVLMREFERKERTDSLFCCGKIIRNDYDCEELLDELYKLPSYPGQFATGKQYGRLKEIQNERQHSRYVACINSGMNERDAAYAFC